MRRKTKGNLLLVLVSVILIIFSGLLNHYLVRLSNKSLKIALDMDEKGVQKGWDLGLLEGIKKAPRISVKFLSSLLPSGSSKPLSLFQYWLFNLGLPAWTTLISSYILLPAVIGIVSWFASSWLWRMMKSKGKLYTKTSIFFFFFFCGLILLKGLKGQFDELLFIIVVLFLFPAAISILVRESRAKKKTTGEGETNHSREVSACEKTNLHPRQ